MSTTTTPALIKALRLAVDVERQYAKAASNTLIQAFFTLGGLRYAAVAGMGAPAAASELQALRQTAQTLLRSQPAGRAVVNLAGTGEVPGAININTLTGQQVRNVPNLIRAAAERVGAIFPPASFARVVSNNVVFGEVNWAAAASGI
jgi:hypothetical protein